MKKRFLFVPVFVSLVLGLSIVIFGQEMTGSIEGTAKDPNGAVIPGVQITVRSVQTTAGARPDATAGFSRTITTDSSGFYRMQQIPPGFYAVTAAPTSGFGEAVSNNVEVVLGRSTVVDLNLPVAGASTVVDVISEDAIAIDPTSNKVQTNITAQTMELLPKGVGFTSVLKTAPAVQSEPLSGGFQIDGASGSENTFIIDGQEVNNFRTGTLNSNNNIPFPLVQEVQVKVSGFEAEFGGATGGVINATTKSGGNDFHGDVGLSFRPAQLQAGPRQFLRLASVTGFSTAEYIQPRRDEGTDFFPSFSLSGPILKDRLWFFAAYAPQYFEIQRRLDYITQDPRNRTITATENYRQRIKQEFSFIRLDLQPIDTIRMMGSFLWNPREQNGTPDTFTNTTSTVPQITFPTGEVRRGAQWRNDVGGRQSSNNTNGSIVWTPTSRFVLTGRGGYSFLNEKIGNYGVPSVGGITRWVVQNHENVPVPTGFGVPGFGQNFPGFSELEYDATIRRTFDVDASYLVSDFGGRHQFKGGFQFNGISNQIRSTLVDTIVIRFGDTIDHVTGIPLDRTPGAIGAGWLQRFGELGAASSDNKALYIQDSWQPITRLTLNIGVRIEKEDSPSFAPGAPGITFGWGDKIAPRLGFAFDLFGDGRTKIFGSYGRFYDRFKYELPRGSFGGNFFRNDYFEIFPGQTINDFNRQTVIGSNPDPIGGNCPLPSSTGLSQCQLDFRIPSNLVGQDIELGAVDPDIKAFQQSEWTFGVERDMGRGYFFSARYTHKQVDYAVEDIGIRAATGGEAYIIGNPGFGLAAEVAEENGFIPLEAEREYDALEFRVAKRFTTSAYFDASYTWSRLFGNYAGLASSDEPTVQAGTGTELAGRTSPNVNRNFDLPFIGFSGLGEPDNGRLATDRPHSFKLSGAYTYDWGGNNSTEIGGFTTIQSGTPRTTRYTFLGVSNQILNGRGDLGRTEMFTQTDLSLSHKYRFGREDRYAMAIDIDVLNVFNEANALTHFDTISTRGIVAADIGAFGDPGCTPVGVCNNQAFVNAIRIYQNENTADIINGIFSAPGVTDLRYGLPSSFQAPRSIRFGFRFLF